MLGKKNINQFLRQPVFCMTLVSIRLNFKIILKMVESVGAFLTQHGAVGMLVLKELLRLQLRLMVIIRVYRITQHGKAIPNRIREMKLPILYVCGQIFAKLESIQYAALGDRNAGIRERYFTYVMTLPSAAFGRLFDLHSKHFTKLKNEKPGLAVKLDKELQELVGDIDIKKLPPTFLLEEKGQFAIGYYHQKQAQFSNKKSEENKEEE